MKTSNIEFEYKGDRNYVHGTDIFNVMMAAFDPSSELKNINFTIHEFLKICDCKLYISTVKSDISALKDIAARCQVNVDDVTHWLAISSGEDTQSSASRYVYDESRITNLCRIEGEGIVLGQASPYSFIETVVAMNKQMHSNLFPDVTGKWIFTRISLPDFCGENNGITLKLRHNMNFKLTKTDIEVDGTKIGDIYFSLVSL